MQSTIFEAKQVRKQYGKYLALDDVSIAVPQGSIFGLLGPNGAGKTSFIRIINQITAPDSGELFFHGKKLMPNHVENIGYLPEERGLYKKMEVGEQCMYLARLKGLSKENAKKRLKYWFEKLEIEGWWNKKVEELSKGMAQKIQFVATVLHEPELLIFDEPFSGFDPVNVKIIKEEILEISKKGATIIFSTHRMDSVEELCDYIALIHKSKKILDGKVKDIRNLNKNNTFSITFKGSLIAFTNALWAGAEIIEKTTEEEDLHTVEIKLLGNNSINNLLQAVLPHVTIVGLQESIPSMDEIFIKTVQA